MIASARGIHVPRSRPCACLDARVSTGLARYFDQQRRKEWRAISRGTLSGKTVGILGLGAIGQSVAAACAALGMVVIGTRMRVQPTPGLAEVHPPEQLGTVLGRSDYLIVTLPLTPKTRHMLGAKELAWLRRESFLIHVSRGGIVDEAALVAALHAGNLAGAGLDVFEDEPLPQSSPLWNAPNLIITPHVGGHVVDYLDRALDVLIDNLECLEQGRPPRNLVDRERGY